ncbi:MAG: MarR family transcriptional regulator [Clostridia bacterium]|nr:MarR family transcriptional regulator [Clostridia bacterium]
MEKKNALGYQIKSLERMIYHRHTLSATRSYVDSLTGTHGWVIRYLYENKDNDIFQRDIEKTFGVRRSTITSMLQIMEKNGLITRGSVPYDSRLKKITPTEKALELHRRISDEIDAIEAELSAGLSEEEISAFISTIEKIKKNLNK